MRKGKKAFAAASALSIMALVVTGTFAWTNFNISIINEFKSSPGGTLHDDFEAPNKDVYIENWGAEPIFVRIRLDEYMEIGEGAGLKSLASIDGVPEPNPGNKSKPILEGDSNIDDISTWKPHVPMDYDAPEISADFGAYWDWDMGGQKYYFPVSKSVRASLLEGAPESSNYVDQNSPENLDANSVNSEGVKAELTPFAYVLTMAKWIDMGEPIGNYWVIDSDGWAYWAAPVAPGTATGLLLDKVTMIDNSQMFYYGINVMAQMATRDGKFSDGRSDNYTNFGDESHGGWTPDGQRLMELITGDRFE
ncbi:MAG: hypothetical protein LBU32_03130 [Clostridiales bacterium]|nr:hypothetical protein [Clostridiales bacterium]